MLASPTPSSTIMMDSFGGASTFSISHSCAQEAMANVQSFDWSDFPVVGDITSCEQSSNNSFYYPSLPSSCKRIAVKEPRSTSPRSVRAIPLVQQEERLRTVSFKPTIRVRTHEVQLGDHPCCLGGLALQSSATVDADLLIDLETFEAQSRKRRAAALRLSYAERRAILCQAHGVLPYQLLQLEYDLQQQQSGHDEQPCRRQILHVSPSRRSLVAYHDDQ